MIVDHGGMQPEKWKKEDILSILHKRLKEVIDFSLERLIGYLTSRLIR